MLVFASFAWSVQAILYPLQSEKMEMAALSKVCIFLKAHFSANDFVD